MITETAVAERITVIDPTVATSACAVSLRGVTKSYGERTAVRELNLDIASGEFFSLLGPSGCGKTTTLRMIGGFVDPSYGEVSLHGKDVTDLPPNRRDVNTVFQSYALFDHLSVWENVAFGLRRRRVGKAEMTRRVGEMLELVQLTGRDKDKPSALSGGQRQRVALARALVNRPSVLLLDEPLAALDLKLRKAMQVELKRIQREVGITFVFVTHDQDEALTMSDRIAVMSEGKVHQCGTPEDIYERPATRFVAEFIGTANLMSGSYTGTGITLPGGVPLHTGRLDGCVDRRRSGDRRAAGEDVALRPHAGHGADRRHPQGHRLRRGHHDVSIRNRAWCRGFGARAEPALRPHRGALGRRRTRPHRLACQAQPRPADLNQELSQ